MLKRTATHDDVIRAIEEERLRVIGPGTIETRGPWPKAKWRSAAFELVNAPGRKSKYARVYFCSSRGHFRCLAHRLIWFALRGPIPEDKIIDHLDEDKLHNVIENFELVTHAENTRRAIASGRYDPSAPKNRKLSWEDAQSIRARVASGESQADVAHDVGASTNMVSRIVLNQTYLRER